MIEFVNPTRENLTGLLANLRQADLEEIRAQGAHDDLNYYLSRPIAHVALVRGEPAYAWGAHEYPAVVWLWGFGSPIADKYKKQFLRGRRAWIQELSEMTLKPILVRVSEDYRAALRWLHWLGFVPAPKPNRLRMGGLWHRILVFEGTR